MSAPEPPPGVLAMDSLISGRFWKCGGIERREWECMFVPGQSSWVNFQSFVLAQWWIMVWERDQQKKTPLPCLCRIYCLMAACLLVQTQLIYGKTDLQGATVLLQCFILVIWAASGQTLSLYWLQNKHGLPRIPFRQLPSERSNFLYSPHWGHCPSELCGILYDNLCIKKKTNLPFKAKSFKYL